MILSKGYWCGQDGCENPWEQDCQQCGATRCDNHIATCRECHLLANFPEKFCHSCAATHEVTKRSKGGCVAQYAEEMAVYSKPKDFQGLMQRRFERYRKRGLWQ